MAGDKVGSSIKVFIGSSTRTKEDVTKIASWLSELGFEVWRWFDESVFLAGQFIYPRLVEIANQVDAAVFVMGEDDDLWYRQDAAPKSIPRDNVLIEYGLFSGVLNPAQVIICRVGSPKMAVDLGGLVYVDMNERHRAELQVKEWAKQLRSQSGLLLTEKTFARFAKEFPNLSDLLEAFAYDETNAEQRILALEKAAKFYTFGGLQYDLREDDIFQDFKIDRETGANLNPVHFSWADTVAPSDQAPGGEAGSVSAWVVPDQNCLRVRFKSLSPWPSNICVRTKDERPLFNKQRRRHLTFEARVAQDQPKVALTMRLVNGWLQHWEYRTKSGAPTTMTVLNNGEFQRFMVDLGDQIRWQRFGADGNHICGPDRAEFNMIIGVVYELGSSNPGSRPGAGQGIIDIRDIRLSD